MGFYKQNIFFSSLALHKKWKPALLLFPGCSQQAPLSPATQEMSSLFSFNGSLLISTVSWQKPSRRFCFQRRSRRSGVFIWNLAHLLEACHAGQKMHKGLEACLSEGRESSKTPSCVWEPSLVGGDGGSDHQAENNWGWLSVWSCFKSGLTPTSKTPGRKWKVKTRLHSLDVFPKWLYHLTSAVFRKRISRFIVTDWLSSRASNTPRRYESASMWLLFFWAW